MSPTQRPQPTRRSVAANKTPTPRRASSRPGAEAKPQDLPSLANEEGSLREETASVSPARNPSSEANAGQPSAKAVVSASPTQQHENETTPSLKQPQSAAAPAVKEKRAAATGSAAAETLTIGSVSFSSMHNFWLTLAFVAALIVLCVFAMHPSCSNAQQVGDSPSSESSVVLPGVFSWDNLRRNDGRYTYEVSGHVLSKLGVDVSENQSVIDWTVAAANGVEFAFIRAGYRGTTEGNLYRDTMFANNLMNAHKTGIPCGAYFYSQAINEDEARAEARLVVEMLDGEPLEYPVAFDAEVHPSVASRIDNLSKIEATAVARAFCEEIVGAGYQAIIYGNSSDLRRFNMDELTEYGLWFAEYATLPNSAEQDFTIWQYTGEGNIPGITTPVDLNIELTDALS